MRDKDRNWTVPLGTAVLMVGHQPMLTLVARDVMSGHLSANTLPLGNSEVACFELQNRSRASLLWLLTEKPPKLLDDLKEKIASKYDVAKFFLGAFVVNTGFILSGEIWKVRDPLEFWLVCIGFLLALVSLAFTFATLASYDRLLMPKEFWTGASDLDAKPDRPLRPRRWGVLRPPSEAAVVLFYEMVHVWKAFFLWAVGFAFAALAAFLVGLGQDKIGYRYGFEAYSMKSWLLLGGLLLLAAACLLIPLLFCYRGLRYRGYGYRGLRPELGFDD